MVRQRSSGVTLPARYSEPWRAPFTAEVSRRLHPGITVLDIGGGRHAAIPRDQRPDGITYIGLDVDSEELEAASDRAYDRAIVADAATSIPELAGMVDLAISWQVFEHVRSLEAVLDHIHAYLRPGGALVSLFSGRWAVFAVANRLLPSRVGVPIVTRVGRRKARNRPVFPAYYDGCSYSRLRRLTSGWRRVEIIPMYRGARYLEFAPILMRPYLAYENSIRRMHVRNAATHYLLVAER